ncbi:efflux RND transporter periplasmic adaptor subunit [Dinghuibacter silviterrae]|uniref:HlyD family secretion protein n=1 Tax=Dinghuibacter silviterrae TaxID=1539049 RepID=A0A4R8DJA1_9BACT|nr:HlyD family efflux transporter periplasmic adaptor subunit [Dinghuibacter silviterrae]TDW97404.1 HlyD family secretion protein [Dinghuibacter silviterrae]
MDRVIKKKKWNSKRILTILGITALVALIVGSFLMASGKTKLNVDAERITISEVTKGPFQMFIPVNGVVMPIETIYIPAEDGGKVEERYVDDGSMMKKGDPILRLSNPDVELNLANQETQVFNTLTQMNIQKTQADVNTVAKKNELADVTNAYNEALRAYTVDKKLFAQHAIGSQEMTTAENTYHYNLKKKELAEQILIQDSISNKEQFLQAEQYYQKMQGTLQMMRQKVADLVVRAPVDGQLTSLDADLGMNKNKGDQLGQIDVLTSYKVRVDVDEHYISQVFNGLRGFFEFADSTYNLEIRKVFTAVKTGGTFQVDMYFLGHIPKGIRRGQTLQIHLNLSDTSQAILIPKGGFYQQTGGNWIFKLSSDGKTAYRQDIQLNRQSPDYYEVVSGVKPGDKVVTSSYDNYEHIQELVINR